MKKLHNICLVAALLLAFCLCGCSGADISLPSRIDMLPGESVALIDLAEYTGDEEITAADTLNLLAEAQRGPEMLEFTFASTVPGVATVDEQGVVSSYNMGDTTITVACAPLDFHAQVQVHVVGYASEIDVQDTLSVAVGDSYELYTMVDGPVELAYTSADPAVATVDENGVVTGLRNGETTVTVAVPGSSLKDVCVVSVGDTVQSVSLSSAEAVLEPGQRLRLVAGTWPNPVGNPYTVAWQSDDESVAVVEDGVVTALTAGAVYITATVGGKQARCAVTVELPATPESATAETALDGMDGEEADSAIATQDATEPEAQAATPEPTDEMTDAADVWEQAAQNTAAAVQQMADALLGGAVQPKIGRAHV